VANFNHNYVNFTKAVGLARFTWALQWYLELKLSRLFTNIIIQRTELTYTDGIQKHSLLPFQDFEDQRSGNLGKLQKTQIVKIYHLYPFP
jgi:hypothetical protein